MTASGNGGRKLPVVEPPPYATPGPPLSDQQFRDAVGAVDFAVDARYAWDAGVAISRFLDGLQEGRILARECRGPCRRVLVPPRMFCEEDFRPTDRWVDVQDTGTVNTFSLCYVTWDMQPLEDPEIPSVIEIDGSDGGFLHKLGEVAPDDVSIGMEVEAVWRPEAERTGSILDIRYFRPRDPSLRRGPKEPAGGGAEEGREDAGGSV
ncbi:MAG TPA: Zn-ribbon domain-containing OB-fold protein [Actinomycetota bacterium]|nr:Zn-ribbon domain-containing OB-fold protein [Actinomycetota bacterium]